MTTRPIQPDKADVAKLYAALLPGQSQAQTASELCAKLGYADTESNRRNIRLLAEYSLDYGMVICSGNAGYWLVKEFDDVNETVARLESQAARMLERSRRLKAEASKLLYQVRLI